jgi:peroxiredoxin
VIEHLSELLASGTAVTVEPVSGQQDAYELRYQRDPKNDEDRMTHQVIVDAGKGWAVTRHEQFFPNGKSARRRTCEYLRTPNGVWMPAKGQIRNLWGGETTGLDWRFTVRRIVVNSPGFDQSVFDIRIPPKFYVTDMRQKVSYWVGEAAVSGGDLTRLAQQSRPPQSEPRQVRSQQTEVPPEKTLWMQALGIVASVLSIALLALMGWAAWGVIRKRGSERRRWFLIGAVGFLIWIGLVAGYYGILFGVYLPAARPNPANKPGTLTRLGQAAPDFSLKTLEGDRFTLSDQRGRVVLLNFFATWCGPCQEELPQLQKIWSEHGEDKAFRMLIIGREESAEKVAAFRAEHRFTFPMAADSDRSVYSRFAEQRIPRTYLISRDGKIVYQCTGYYEAELGKLKTILTAELGNVSRPRR